MATHAGSGRTRNAAARRRAGFVLAPVLAASLLSSCQTTQRPGHPDEEEFSPKSVVLGELIAIFPGIIWHGLGHRYAGDDKKAQEIEMMEAYSLVAGGIGTGLIFAGRSNENLTGLEYTGYTVGGIGGLGFIGTWIYDIIYTPSAIDRYNARKGDPGEDQE